jgi:hypothetical protein
VGDHHLNPDINTRLRVQQDAAFGLVQRPKQHHLTGVMVPEETLNEGRQGGDVVGRVNAEGTCLPPSGRQIVSERG